jgi:hypothetical protein
MYYNKREYVKDLGPSGRLAGCLPVGQPEAFVSSHGIRHRVAVGQEVEFEGDEAR